MRPDPNPPLLLDFQGQGEVTDSQDQGSMLHLATQALQERIAMSKEKENSILSKHVSASHRL